MRISLVCYCMFFIMQYTHSQSTNTCTASILRRNVSVLATIPHGPVEYNLHTADKKLKTARRCIIAGSVLTAGGVAMMTGGAVYALTPHPAPDLQPGQVQPHHGDATAPAIWICSIPLFVSGIPLLTIGLTQRKKWKHIKTDSSIQTGIFNNGQPGIALNF